MQQIEIEYFFPLTEQIPLDLDYTQPEKPQMWTTGTLLNVGNGSVTWADIAPTTLQFRPEPDMIGYWQIDNNIQVWRKTKPVWLHRKMTKVFFGWEWKNK
jgi:hypothetical protein